MKNLAFIILGLFLISCGGGNSFKTDAGTKVTYITKGEGALPTDSLICLFTVRYTTEDDQEMAHIKEPFPVKLDSNTTANQGELFQVLSKMRTGDSVGFELVAKELFANTFRAPIPDSIPEDSKIKFKVSLVNQMSESGYFEYATERAKVLAEKQLKIDAEIINNYLDTNEIEALSTESGLRYVITEAGTGPKPEAGQVVRVAYVGRVLDGAYFDTSNADLAKEKGIYNAAREPYEPYTFPLGRGQVIRGWDEGIGLLNEGGKATLYIPSSLGYADRGSGRIIKPNSILEFEVELVEIVQN